jgi:CheY-like chemotaxis protein
VFDVQKPKMRDDELARRLRLRDTDAKVLYLTGYVDQVCEERAVLRQREAFLETPTTVEA